LEILNFRIQITFSSKGEQDKWHIVLRSLVARQNVEVGDVGENLVDEIPELGQGVQLVNTSTGYAGN
jgi:hypothetical protein